MKTAILFILMMLVLVIPHEWGHMMVAKRCGVRVNEFSMGMGPLIHQWKKGETQYSLRLLPIGGYCAMMGEETAEDDPRSYSTKSPLQKIAILLAGVTMNILIAALVLTITFFISGVTTTTLSEVTAGSPAAEAGIEAGDKIVSIDGAAISSWDDVVTAVDSYHVGDRLDIVYTRSGKSMEALVTPEYDKETGRYLIGIVAGKSRNPLLCIAGGITSTWNLNKMMISSFQQLIRGGVSKEDVAGPVGLVRLVNQTSSYGAESYLILLALVSLNLAFFNLIPIPGLDGGKIFFVLLKVITRGRIGDDMEYKATIAGMVLILALFVLITYNDVMNLIG